MRQNKKVPLVVVRRLPRYYRYLSELLAAGVERISSQKLAEELGVTASQLRQDLNCFGGFGQQGYGYHVPQLKEEIEKILGLDRSFGVVVIGAGNLGRALVNYHGFTERGFRFLGIFDIDKKLIGTKAGRLTVQDISKLSEFCKKHKPQIGVLALPKEVAFDMAKQLKELGVLGIWNFSHIDIDCGIPVENVHLGDSLMTLSYELFDGE